MGQRQVAGRTPRLDYLGDSSDYPGRRYIARRGTARQRGSTPARIPGHHGRIQESGMQHVPADSAEHRQCAPGSESRPQQSAHPLGSLQGRHRCLSPFRRGPQNAALPGAWHHSQGCNHCRHTERLSAVARRLAAHRLAVVLQDCRGAARKRSEGYFAGDGLRCRTVGCQDYRPDRLRPSAAFHDRCPGKDATAESLAALL